MPSASSRASLTRIRLSGPEEPYQDVDPDPGGLLERRPYEVANAPDEGTGLTAQLSWWWSAPLPPPPQLEHYDAILPGLAERIVSMTETEMTHRHRMDRSFVAYRFLGQWISAIIALAALGAGSYIVSTGHAGYGFAAIVTAVAGLVGVFLVRQFFGNGQAGAGDENK